MLGGPNKPWSTLTVGSGAKVGSKGAIWMGSSLGTMLAQGLAGAGVSAMLPQGLAGASGAAGAAGATVTGAAGASGSGAGAAGTTGADEKG